MPPRPLDWSLFSFSMKPLAFFLATAEINYYASLNVIYMTILDLKKIHEIRFQ